MNLKQLRHFLVVVEEGSLGRAAEKLHLSQPAISKSIQKLEEELGVAVLNRDSQRPTLTTFGTALVAHARLLEAQAARAKREIAALRGLERGHVSIGIGPSTALAILPQAAGRLRQLYPGVTLSVVEGLASVMMQALLDGDADFIVAPALPLPSGQVKLEPLYTDQVALICRAGHPLTRRKTIGLSNLLEWPWVMPHRPDTFRDYVEATLQAEGIIPPVPAWETNSFPLIKAALIDNDAITFLPVTAILGEKQFTALRRGPFSIERKVFVIRRALDALSPAAEALLAELRREAARLTAKL